MNVTSQLTAKRLRAFGQPVYSSILDVDDADGFVSAFEVFAELNEFVGSPCASVSFVIPWNACDPNRI